MARLHVYPQDAHGFPSARWNWVHGREQSTLGYPTPEAAVDNARWRDVPFEGVVVHERTAAQEAAAGAALLWEHERSQR